MRAINNFLKFIGVTSAQVATLKNCTSEIQTQINTKSPIASPTFTGSLCIGASNVALAPNSFAAGENSFASCRYYIPTAFHSADKGVTLTGNFVAYFPTGSLVRVWLIPSDLNLNFTVVSATLNGGNTDVLFAETIPSTYYGASSCRVVAFQASADGNGTLVHGHRCIATGFGAHAEGTSCIASGDYAHAEGNSCTATYGGHAEGANSIANGVASHAENTTTLASGTPSHAEGSSTQATATGSHSEGYSSLASIYCQHAKASGCFSSTGDAQYSNLVARNTTSNATQTSLYLDGSNTRIVLANNKAYLFNARIVARNTAGNDSAAYEIKGLIDRVADAASTALVGIITVTTIAEDSAGWDVTAEADATNGALVFKVTGEAGKSIHWVAFVEMVEAG